MRPQRVCGSVDFALPGAGGVGQTGRKCSLTMRVPHTLHAREGSIAHRHLCPGPEEGSDFYPGSAWSSALFVGGYESLDPPPEITPDGVVAAISFGDGRCPTNSGVTSATLSMLA